MDRNGCSFVIVANPTSGRGRAKRTAERTGDRLRRHGHTVDIRFTSRQGEAEEIAAAACVADGGPPSCVVACGGDGTIQEIANALVHHRRADGEGPALGLAPAGRCNDFARALGIERDVDRIAGVLLEGRRRSIDLGCVNGRYFCTVATLGADAEVSRFVDSMRMPLKGTIAYVYGAIRVLMRYRARHVRMEGDFGRLDQHVFLASSANTSSYGGAIKIVPHADPTDGRLELCVIDSVSRLRSFFLLPRVLFGRHTRLGVVRFLSTARFRIESDEEVEMWADGERLTCTPAEVEICPQALEVMVPR